MDVNLDRRITIKKKSSTLDPAYRSPVVSWVPLATVWAEVIDVQPNRSESVRQGLEQASNQTRIRIRFRDDVNSSMRVEYRGRILQIIAGPAELGRREYLELMCEAYTSSGENP